MDYAPNSIIKYIGDVKRFILYTVSIDDILNCKTYCDAINFYESVERKTYTNTEASNTPEGRKQTVLQGKQQELMVEWKAAGLKVKAAWPEVFAKYEADPTNKISFRELRKYLIGALYYLQPPVRGDYANMKIVQREPPLTEKANFLLWPRKGKPQFIFRIGKLSRLNGMNNVHLDISPLLLPILKDYIELSNPRYLLVLETDPSKPVQRQTLKKDVPVISEMLTGKPAGIQIIRIAYVRELAKTKPDMSLRELDQHARSMLQTTASIFLSYNKKTEAEKEKLSSFDILMTAMGEEKEEDDVD